MMHLRLIGVAALMMGCLLQPTVAQEPMAAPAGSGVQLGRLLRDTNADLPRYACDLRPQFNQCRQYFVAPGNAELRVKELSEACASLDGVLTQSPCPQENVIAQCKEVKFRRDAVYDASYYPGAPSDWTVGKLQEVCRNLPGNFVSLDR